MSSKHEIRVIPDGYEEANVYQGYASTLNDEIKRLTATGRKVLGFERCTMTSVLGAQRPGWQFKLMAPR